jgi:flagellin-like protein
MRRFLREHKAQVGIGTLIVFIAMILVAAVAAGVLLRTSGTLQQRATVTGEQSIKEVSTILKVPTVIGYAAVPANNQIDAVLLTIQLASGSGNVRFADIMMTYQEGNTYLTGIEFNESNDALYYAEDVIPENLDNGALDFGIKRLKEDGDRILEIGESVELVFWVENATDNIPLDPDDTFIINLNPKGGQITNVKKTVPPVISYEWTSEWG